jgi:hypothetical protein
MLLVFEAQTNLRRETPLYMFKLIRRYSSYLKIVTLLIFSNGLLQSCCSPSIDNKTFVDENTMISIAKYRECNCGDITFDSCIESIEPHFDKLSSQGQNQVALNFIIYGQLDAGSSEAFGRLLNPRHVQITNYLKQVGDVELKNKFRLNEKEVARYRRGVEIYSNSTEQRG